MKQCLIDAAKDFIFLYFEALFPNNIYSLWVSLISPHILS